MQGPPRIGERRDDRVRAVVVTKIEGCKMGFKVPRFIRLLPEGWKVVEEYQTSRQRLDLDT